VNFARHERQYYSFTLVESHEDLSISVTPFSGDPDIYASNVTNHPSSTPGQYVWKSTHYGADVITITQAALGTYFISVYAYTQTSFTITGESKKISNLCVEFCVEFCYVRLISNFWG